MINKFNKNGSLFLEIFNPELFLAKVKNAISEKNLDLAKIYPEDCYWIDVEYSKASLVSTTQINHQNTHLFQKPKEQLSPMVVSKFNGLPMDRPIGLSGLMVEGDDLFEPLWPVGANPINYEEELECRLVLDGFYSMVIEDKGVFRKMNDDLKLADKPTLLPDEKKLLYVDLICGDLSDCVRIRDIKEI